MDNKVIVDIYHSGRNFSACVPLLPGCVATGTTTNQVIQRIDDAIKLHVNSSIMDEDEIPNIFKGPYTLIHHFNK